MEQKGSVVIEILLFPLFIIKYFFLGLKVLFFDSFKALASSFKNNKKDNLSEEDLKRKQQVLEQRISNTPSTDSKKTHIYKYIVKDADNNVIKGKTIGKSLQEVYTFLQSEYEEVYELKSSFLIDAFYKETNIGSTKLSNKNLIFLLTQLSTYLKAGLTLNDAIKTLCAQMKVSKTQLQALQAVHYDLNLGESFSVALEHQKKVFPSLLINMVKAAEASGTLIETLDDMAKYYTETDDSHKQMVTAISYPLIILFFSIAVIIFVMVYVVPQFEKIYASSDAPVEGVTKVLITISNFMKSNILYIILGIVLIIIFVVTCYKMNKEFRKFIQSFMMRIPVIKNIIIYNELSIFSKTFASLLKNNVYITESMDLLEKITNNEVYKEIFNQTVNNIVKGDKISDAFKDHWAIPDVAYYMIVTGEETGELEQMMEKVSDYYQTQHRTLVNNFRTFLEPILISFLAVVVGFIIISVIIPMFDIYGTIK